MIGYSSNPSLEECLKHVLEKEPTASGMQYHIADGRCHAEFGTTSIISPNGSFKSCYFPDNSKECKKVDTCTVGDDTTQGNCGDKSSYSEFTCYKFKTGSLA
jgi:hypothetical protein